MTIPKPSRPAARPDRVPSVEMRLTLPAPLYDKTYADARAHRMTVPQWIRHALQRTPPPRPADR